MKRKIKNVSTFLSKGIIALFALKFIILGSIFLVQSCGKNNDYFDENVNNAEDLFLKSLTQTSEKFKSIPVIAGKSENSLLQRIQNSEPCMMVKILNEGKALKFSDLADVTDGLVRGDIELVLDPNLIQQEADNLMQIQVSESDLQGALARSINASKNYLYALGFSDYDITDVLLGHDESLLIQLVYASITIQNENNSTGCKINQNNFISLLMGFQTVQAQITWREVGACAVAAIGLDIIQEMRDETAGKKMTKTVLKKAFTKVAGKLASYLTGFGLAWTTAYFVGCISYSYFN